MAAKKKKNAPAETKGPLLNDELRRRIKASGRAQAEIADLMGIREGTLRNWLSNNRYPAGHLRELVRHVDPSIKLSHFEFEESAGAKRLPRRELRRLAEASVKEGDPTARWRQIFAALDDRVARVLRLDEDFGQDVLILFRAMSAGDVFVYWSVDQYPYEATAEGTDTAALDVARAIERGATFIYLIPHEDLLERLQGDGLRGLPRQSDFEATLADFRWRLAEGADDSAMTGKPGLETRLIALPCKAACFIAPGHKFVLFRCRDARLTRSLARFPVKGRQEKDEHLHLPLGTDLQEQFLGFINRAFEQAGRPELKKLML